MSFFDKFDADPFREFHAAMKSTDTQLEMFQILQRMEAQKEANFQVFLRSIAAQANRRSGEERKAQRREAEEHASERRWQEHQRMLNPTLEWNPLTRSFELVPKKGK